MSEIVRINEGGGHVVGVHEVHIQESDIVETAAVPLLESDSPAIRVKKMQWAQRAARLRENVRRKSSAGRTKLQEAKPKAKPKAKARAAKPKPRPLAEMLDAADAHHGLGEPAETEQDRRLDEIDKRYGLH